MSKPDLPSMDQLWDRVPENPDALAPDAWDRWVSQLSPKARTALEAALARGPQPCGVPEWAGDVAVSKTAVLEAMLAEQGLPIETITPDDAWCPSCRIRVHELASSCPRCGSVRLTNVPEEEDA